MLPILKKYSKKAVIKVKRVKCTGAPTCAEKCCVHFWPHVRDNEPEIDCRPGVCMSFDKQIECVEVNTDK